MRVAGLIIYMARIRKSNVLYINKVNWALGAKIQSSSGYWSQNSPVQILGIKGDAAHLNIQWPHSSKTTESIQGK